MARISTTSHLLNPLATSAQLETSASQLDGVPRDLENAVRYETMRLLQAAGILLHLPQELIAQSIVILQRFWAGPDGGSILDYNPKAVAAASLYLVAKPSANPVSPRQTLTAVKYLASTHGGRITSGSIEDISRSEWSFSEGSYDSAKNELYEIEAQILRVLGFQTHVALPYTLCINYLQTLDLFQSPRGSIVAKNAFAHLNSALLSPQLLYLTHQPSALATAAIYLAAREAGVKLAEVEWWEVFDVDREELGFLVVALRSLEGYATAEQQRWPQRNALMTIEDIRSCME